MTPNNKTSLRRTLSALCLGLLLHPATAQSVVVPAQYANVEAPNAVFWALSPFDARRQLLIEGSHLTAVHQKTLRAFRVRRNAGDPEPLAQSFLHLTVHLSETAKPATQASEVFAQNRGSKPQQVFRGRLDLPASPAPKSKPAPWAGPHAVQVPLQSPYVYGGRTLCLETLTTLLRGAGTNKLESPWWPIDGVRNAYAGAVQPYGQSCVSDMRNTPAGADAASQALGSTALVYLRGPRQAGSGLLAFGLNDKISGGARLPLDLGRFGAPNCSLYLDPLLMVPFRLQRHAGIFTAHGRAVVGVPVPWDTRLAGRSYYTQWIVNDSGRNNLGLTFSNGVRATLSLHSKSTGLAWLEATDTNSKSGRLLPGRTPVLRFDI